MNIIKTERLLRASATFLLLLVVVLVVSDTQTKVMFIARKATYKYLDVLGVLVGVDAAAAGYNLLQLLRSITCSRYKDHNMVSYRTLSWIYFLLDQVVVYLVFSTTSAAISGSMFAITGYETFEWMKLCDKYTRFCYQIGAALLFGLVVSILLVAISFISAFNLFRLYSPKRFFRLKGM